MYRIPIWTTWSALDDLHAHIDALRQHPPATTPQALAAATVRYQAIVNIHANEVYPDNNLPQWAVQERQSMRQLRQDMEQNDATIQQSQQQVDARIQQLEAVQAAAIWNLNATKHNARCAGAPAVPLTLRPFRKTSPGQGPPLPGRRALPGVPVLHVDDLVPTPHFPETIAAIHALSHDQINILGMMLNETFDIQPGDTLTHRQFRLRTFLAIY